MRNAFFRSLHVLDDRFLHFLFSIFSHSVERAVRASSRLLVSYGGRLCFLSSIEVVVAFLGVQVDEVVVFAVVDFLCSSVVIDLFCVSFPPSGCCLKHSSRASCRVLFSSGATFLRRYTHDYCSVPLLPTTPFCSWVMIRQKPEHARPCVGRTCRRFHVSFLSAISKQTSTFVSSWFLRVTEEGSSPRPCTSLFRPPTVILLGCLLLVDSACVLPLLLRVTEASSARRYVVVFTAVHEVRY